MAQEDQNKAEKQSLKPSSELFSISILDYSCLYLQPFWNRSPLIGPYWRLYYNYTEGGFLEISGKQYEIEKDRIYIIPPYTKFIAKRSGNPLHFFIHFTLGSSKWTIREGIFSYPLNNKLRELMGEIFNHQPGYVKNRKNHLRCLDLISYSLQQLPEYPGDHFSIDQRIAYALDLMEQNKPEVLPIKVIADDIAMSADGFSRLFKKVTGIAPLAYQIRQRMDTAAMYLINPELSIDEIAEITGFSDRHSLSKSFIRRRGIGPGKFRKEQGLE